jgi:hypothetical protein
MEPFFGLLPLAPLADGLADGLAGGLACMPPPELDMPPELDPPDAAGVSCSTTPASLAS